MARRRRRRGLGGLGAVARGGSSYRRQQHSRRMSVRVDVHRNIGAANARQYVADACVGVLRRDGTYRAKAARCGTGSGRTPTAASKKALHRLATKLK